MKHGSAQLLLFVLLSVGAPDLNAGRTDSTQVRGAQLYRNYCERCHGADGAGSVNISRNTVWAKEPTELVKIIAFGARGPSSSGNRFHRAMPPAPYNDEEIALVTMYTMQSIGKRDVTISTEEVRRARLKHLDSVQRKIKSKR